MPSTRKNTAQKYPGPDRKTARDISARESITKLLHTPKPEPEHQKHVSHERDQLKSSAHRGIREKGCSRNLGRHR
jgi:hypothetical protein